MVSGSLSPQLRSFLPEFLQAYICHREISYSKQGKLERLEASKQLLQSDILMTKLIWNTLTLFSGCFQGKAQRRKVTVIFQATKSFVNTYWRFDELTVSWLQAHSWLNHIQTPFFTVSLILQSPILGCVSPSPAFVLFLGAWLEVLEGAGWRGRYQGLCQIRETLGGRWSRRFKKTTELAVGIKAEGSGKGTVQAFVRAE